MMKVRAHRSKLIEHALGTHPVEDGLNRRSVVRVAISPRALTLDAHELTDGEVLVPAKRVSLLPLHKL